MNANTSRIENLSSLNPMETVVATQKKHILIVDDDVASCRTLQLHLRSEGYDASIAHSVDQGLAVAHEQHPDLVILDIRMPGKSGLEGLPEFKQTFPGIHVIMITAFHDMDSTIEAMQHGAEDYIHKPIDIDELDKATTRILSSSGHTIVDTSRENQAPLANTMVASSRAMKEVFKTIGLVANSQVTVLITGDSGTGKELVASAIHRTSKDTSGSFVAVNCAALVETLLESDMFGHEKGAFTGAVNKQLGKFALADKGTIFLDEIGELSPTMQAKLLRVLQEKEFTPVGAKSPQHSSARVIAATNVDLAARVRDGLFREDLYYRLRVVTIHLPPLRERREDIVDLVQALLARINKQMNRNVTQLSSDVMTCLENYDWPGNVRELANALEKAVALCSGDVITRDLIGDICDTQTPTDQEQQIPLSKRSLEDVEKSHVQLVLEATRWHKGHTCEILGVSRPRLRRMIKHFELINPYGANHDMDDDNDELDSDINSQDDSRHNSRQKEKDSENDNNHG